MTRAEQIVQRLRDCARGAALTAAATSPPSPTLQEEEPMIHSSFVASLAPARHGSSALPVSASSAAEDRRWLAVPHPVRPAEFLRIERSRHDETRDETEHDQRTHP
jgi:hypothetical protein